MTANSSTIGTNYAVTDYTTHMEHNASVHDVENIPYESSQDGAGSSGENSDFATIFYEMLTQEQASAQSQSQSQSQSQAATEIGAGGGLGGFGANAMPPLGFSPISMPGMDFGIGSTTMEQNLLGVAANTDSSGDQMALAMLMLMMMMQSGGGGDMSMFQMIISALLPQLENATQSFNNNANNPHASLPLMSTANSQSSVLTNTTDGMPTSSAVGFASATLPLNVSMPATPVVTSNVHDRSPERYRAIIDQFHVETAERYRPGRDGFTYCNIFVLDVTRAMGAHIPHLGAINMCNWLGTTGRQHGWREVDAATAQAHANMGRPAVTSAGSIGHVQMVVPSRTPFNPQVGVSIAQAGRINTNYAPISTIYGANTLQNRIRYFIHD